MRLLYGMGLKSQGIKLGESFNGKIYKKFVHIMIWDMKAWKKISEKCLCLSIIIGHYGL